MAKKLYHVHLSEDERSRLEQTIRTGLHAARTRMLLKAADGWAADHFGS